jgi:hypothetical protein
MLINGDHTECLCQIRSNEKKKKPHLQSKEMRLGFFWQKPLIMGNHGSRIRFSNVERSEDIPIQQKGQDFEMLLNGAAHKEW